MKNAILIGAMALLVGAAGVARADDRKDIEALYAKLRTAIQTNHPEQTLAMETPDFKSVDAQGKVTDGKALAKQMKQQGAGTKNGKMDIKITKLDIKGKNADVATEFVFTSEMVDNQGQMGPKGKKHVMGMAGQVSNTLLKTPQGWKFKSMKELPGSKMTVDGKPMGIPGMGAPPKKK